MASGLTAPSGYEVMMNGNHMLSKPAMIGKVNDKGLFESYLAFAGTHWSGYLEQVPSGERPPAKLTADWTYPWICGGCAEPTVKD